MRTTFNVYPLTTRFVTRRDPRMKTSVSCSTFALVGLSLSALTATPAAAQLMIIPTFDSTITSDPNAAAIETTINNAISVYEHTFSNPITVSVLIHEDQSIGLGQSAFVADTVDYNTFRTALQTTKGPGGAGFLANLPTSGNPVPGNSNAGVAASTANLRAIGLS